MVTEMVERVARAICEADGDTPSNLHEYQLERARFAIRAMRDPTEQMLPGPSRDPEPESATDTWQSMIDAALKE